MVDIGKTLCYIDNHQRKGGKQMGNKKNNPKRWTEWLLQISAGVISGVISGLIVWFITK